MADSEASLLSHLLAMRDKDVTDSVIGIIALWKILSQRTTESTPDIISWLVMVEKDMGTHSTTSQKYNLDGSGIRVRLGRINNS